MASRRVGISGQQPQRRSTARLASRHVHAQTIVAVLFQLLPVSQAPWKKQWVLDANAQQQQEQQEEEEAEQQHQPVKRADVLAEWPV